MINCRYAFMVESNDDKFQDLFKKIQTKNYDIGPLVDSGSSKEEIGFIKGYLTKNIFNRFDTEQCLNHPWIQKYSTKNESNTLKVDVKNIVLDFEKNCSTKRNILFYS